MIETQQNPGSAGEPVEGLRELFSAPPFGSAPGLFFSEWIRFESLVTGQ